MGLEGRVLKRTGIPTYEGVILKRGGGWERRDYGEGMG